MFCRFRCQGAQVVWLFAVGGCGQRPGGEKRRMEPSPRAGSWEVVSAGPSRAPQCAAFGLTSTCVGDTMIALAVPVPLGLALPTVAAAPVIMICTRG